MTEDTRQLLKGIKPNWYYVVVHKITYTYSIRKGSFILENGDYFPIEYKGLFYGHYKEDEAVNLLRKILQETNCEGDHLLKDERLKEKLINSIEL